MMNVPFVDLKAQYQSLKQEIDPAIQAILNETAFVGGKYVEAFEQAFAKKFGVKHCVSCANGTDAIYITLKMPSRPPSSRSSWAISTIGTRPGTAMP